MATAPMEPMPAAPAVAMGAEVVVFTAVVHGTVSVTMGCVVTAVMEVMEVMVCEVMTLDELVETTAEDETAEVELATADVELLLQRA